MGCTDHGMLRASLGVFQGDDHYKENLMKLGILVAAAFATVTLSNAALAQTKEEKCAAYARNAAASTPTTTGVARGAARGAAAGAVGGAITGNVGGGAGVGAAVGAGVGMARGAAQKSRSYQYYYDECMKK
jgi:hypothetical protein